MVSEKVFRKHMREQYARYKQTYPRNQDAVRFHLHDWGHMIRGYHESSGSNQQQIMVDGVELYNSDFTKLTENQLITLLVKTVDFSTLHIVKPQYYLREIDTREDVQRSLGRDAPYLYAQFKTRKEAETFASVKKTFPYISGIDLMKERYANQYPSRDYIFIKKIK